jgi:peptidyl-prolyl cis-trans isomerase SurA
MNRSVIVWSLAGALVLAACGGDEETHTSAAPAPQPEAPPAPEPPAEEACAQVIVVAWQGAVAASSEITRSESDARARAEEIRHRLDAGENFALLARSESDASSSGPRGGLIGTYTRDAWPSVHEPIRDAVFGLQVNQMSDVIHAPYGWVIARRCPVQKVHTRHILVRFRGARNAPAELTRTRDEARALATQIRAQVAAPGADFAAIARERSEDGSAESGGDLGSLGRGRLAPEYERAAFALEPNQISQVVETEFGFHVIQRLPDDA